jgi:ATP-binding cassette, subfamily B, bacterial
MPKKRNSFAATLRLREAWARTAYLPRALGLIWTATRGWAAAQLVLLLVQGILPACLVYLTKFLIDNLTLTIRTGVTPQYVRVLVWYGLLMGVVMLASEVLGGLEPMIRTALTERLQDHIFTMIHQQSIAIDLEFYEQPDYFDHLHRARDEALYRPVELTAHLATVFKNCVTLIAMGALLSRFGFWLPTILLLSTLPALYVVVHFTVKSHELRRRKTAEHRRTSYFDWLLTSAEPAAELRLFGLGSFFSRRFEAARSHLRHDRLRLAIRQHLSALLASLLALAITAIAVVWMVWRVTRASGTFGDLVLFYQALNQGQALMRSLVQSAGHIYASSLFLGDLFEYLSLKPKIVDPAQPVPTPTSPRYEISFENVSFGYQNSQKMALRNFTLRIPANRIVAIVGDNGAGKSTVLKLLCRFYDPQRGAIKIDGTDVRHYSIQEVRRMISVFFQPNVHYSTTVRENIELGDIAEPSSQKEIESAAQASGADTIVGDLADGYENLLGTWFPGGTDLSIGEWQRIGLARAFFRKAPIILLDEPTSVMDPWAENDWLKRLLKVTAGQTVVIVTHRFTTARYADVIHVMQEGRIIESGTHEELITGQGRYAESWANQMRESPARPSSEAAYVEL